MNYAVPSEVCQKFLSQKAPDVRDGRDKYPVCAPVTASYGVCNVTVKLNQIWIKVI